MREHDQEELAARMGVDQGYLSWLELGQRNPTSSPSGTRRWPWRFGPPFCWNSPRSPRASLAAHAYLVGVEGMRRLDLRDAFAANLRRIRHAKGLSQDDLAYKAEISRSYLSQLEKGAFHASLKIIGRLADALQAEPAEFLKLPAKKACKAG